ncbi:hypothetical protein P171DRAFT_438445 [Karstenula rhodostoma CBS 690.94]|uniref:Tat pathway signal sequence n=1 Tax=Karstenula rhodostoma CBS 690.94 TaxID=1392251 RepID=A0A9P4PWJ0_9PLEO|nr:hypothetical protein P171DRAFT_438445 [Karstenula rhodostoma CBS 690.94]
MNIGLLLKVSSWKPTRLYSPANSILNDKIVTFGSSVEGTGYSEYQGAPDEKNNKLWRALYNNSPTAITASEARLLPNKTASATPWLDPEISEYVLLLNVFHNLHCLDRLRQTIWYFHEPQFNITSNPYTMYNGNITAALRDRGASFMDIVHADHCIEMLRQSAMCESDVTPIVYQYSEKTGKSTGRTGVIHQCRDFGKVQEWAKERVATVPDVWGKGVELGLCAIDDPETCVQAEF